MQRRTDLRPPSLADHCVGLHSTRSRLVREWARLSRRPSAVRAAAAWGITDPAPVSLDEVLRAVGAGGDLSRAADERLRHLVSIARDDDLAARVVIERLTPGLLKLAGKYRGAGDEFEDLLAAAWIAIRTYNPTRRPSNIAVALLSDAEYAAYRRSFRRKEHTDRPASLPDQLAALDDRHPADELADVLDDAVAAGLPAADADLVRRLVMCGSTEVLARELDVTSRTIRNRRARAIAAVRELTAVGAAPDRSTVRRVG